MTMPCYYDKGSKMDTEITEMAQELLKIKTGTEIDRFAYERYMITKNKHECRHLKDNTVFSEGGECMICGEKKPMEEKTKMENQNTDKTVNLGETGVIELPQFDIKPYLGKMVKIGTVEEKEGQYGYYVKVSTESLGTVNDKPVTASRIFGLEKDTEGKVGWTKEMKLGLYLTKHQVAHYKELVGKEVMTQSKQGKGGKEYLDFN